MALNGLSQIFCELEARCDKTHLCQFCGHQDRNLNKDMTFGTMPLDLLASIRDQVPQGIVVALHRDGEPTAYPHLAAALHIFRNHITSIVTHGLNLAKKADEIIGNCTSLTVSIFHNDQDKDDQIRNVRTFLSMKGNLRPMVNLKLIGEGDSSEYESLGVPIIQRLLHVPSGNHRYIRRDPVIPEHGICLDFLSKPSISWDGTVYICNRFDPKNEGRLGNLKDTSLDDLWNGPVRAKWLDAHMRGKRKEASVLCSKCLYYGVPSA